MGNAKVLKLIKKGFEEWNDFREKSLPIVIDMSDTDFRRAIYKKKGQADTSLSGHFKGTLPDKELIKLLHKRFKSMTPPR